MILAIVTLGLAAAAIGCLSSPTSQGVSPGLRVSGTAISTPSSTIVRVDIFNDGNIALSISRAEVVGMGDLTSRGENPLKPSCSGAATGTVSHVEPGAFITVRAFALAGNTQVVDQAGVVVAG